MDRQTDNVTRQGFQQLTLVEEKHENVIVNESDNSKKYALVTG